MQISTLLTKDDNLQLDSVNYRSMSHEYIQVQP